MLMVVNNASETRDSRDSAYGDQAECLKMSRSSLKTYGVKSNVSVSSRDELATAITSTLTI